MRRAWVLCAVAVAALCKAEEESELSLQKKAFDARAKKDYVACATAMDRIFARGQKSIGALYYGAGCYAMAGQTDKAFGVLERALDQPVDRDSFFNFERLEKDPRLQLDALKPDPRWAPLAARTGTRRRSFLESEASEMFEIYVADQADRWRLPLDKAWVAPRDRERREKTIALIEHGRLRSAEDYDEAAFIFQHGNDYLDIGRAHDLALKAHALDPERRSFRWTVAATLDRFLWLSCRPQVFGTQFQVTDGRYTIEPLDKDLIDDAERERWGVPPLSAAHDRERKLNEQLAEEEKANGVVAPPK